MLAGLALNSDSDLPLYRQLAEAIARQIQGGEVHPGDRLPPTRELSNLLGLNRTTVSAAYSLLEEQGLIRGHVGRGSFVAEWETPSAMAGLDWETILPKLEPVNSLAQAAGISFANSRPAGTHFPMAAFRQLAKEVIDSPDAQEILQLGSPLGYAPLRRYLLEEAQAAGVARPGDDLIITNGCQQALDLLARVLLSPQACVVVEDPVYHGLLKVLERTGAKLIPAPVGSHGIDPEALETLFAQHKPRVAIITPSFQNPTGTTVPLPQRRRLVELVARYGVVLIENDIYSGLHYGREPLPALKQLEESGSVILLRSYSKVSFPGLRVGWVIAPRPVIQRLADLKQTTDLHSDQLAQAVLLQFARSGELARHLESTRQLGAQRLRAALDACEQFLPEGSTFTRPEGGMNLWVRLPMLLDARDLLARVQQHGVNFLPGNYFSTTRGHEHCLRLSFGGLSPEEIRQGIQILGSVAARKLADSTRQAFEPASALV
jgi:2-aminoadipate transaminase